MSQQLLPDNKEPRTRRRLSAPGCVAAAAVLWLLGLLLDPVGTQEALSGSAAHAGGRVVWMVGALALSSVLAVWVWRDAARRNLSERWVFATLFFWVMAFPCYLFARAGRVDGAPPDPDRDRTLATAMLAAAAAVWVVSAAGRALASFWGWP